MLLATSGQRPGTRLHTLGGTGRPPTSITKNCRPERQQQPGWGSPFQVFFDVTCHSCAGNSHIHGFVFPKRSPRYREPHRDRCLAGPRGRETA